MFHSAHIPGSPLCANQRGAQSIIWWRGKTTSPPRMGRKPPVQASLFSVRWNWNMKGTEMVQKSPLGKRKASTRLKGQLSSSDCPTKSKTRHQTTKSVQFHPPMLSPEEEPSWGQEVWSAVGCWQRRYNRSGRGAHTRVPPVVCHGSEAGQEASAALRTARENRDGVSERSKSKYRGNKWMNKLNRGCLILLNSWIWNNSRHC